MQLIIPRAGLLALLGFLVATGAALAAIIYLPRATVSLTPATSPRQGVKEMILSTQAQEPDFIHFTLPARLVERRVEAQETISRTGVDGFDDFAKGTVTLINQQDEEQPLLPKTHLRHEASGVFFLTDTAVRIPPQGEVPVGITAKEKGAAGNVAAGKFIIDKLPASTQSVIYATSQSPTSGGLAVQQPLTAAEIEQAKATMLESLRTRAGGELTAEAGGAPIRPDLVSLTPEVAEVSASAGSQTKDFTIHLRLAARAFVVDENDILSLTLLALRSATGTNEELVSYEPESFRVSISQADFERGEARVKGELTGLFSPKIEPGVFAADKLAGLSANEVREYLKQFPSVGQTEVKFWPFWVRSVPARPGATKIEVKNTK